MVPAKLSAARPGDRLKVTALMKQMKILLSNDDGVDAPGLRILAAALRETARVVVVAPDRERSAIGTAVTLRRPLRLTEHAPLAPGVETWAVNGTPGDSVIIGAKMPTSNSTDDSSNRNIM